MAMCRRCHARKERGHVGHVGHVSHVFTLSSEVAIAGCVPSTLLRLSLFQNGFTQVAALAGVFVVNVQLQ